MIEESRRFITSSLLHFITSSANLCGYHALMLSYSHLLIFSQSHSFTISPSHHRTIAPSHHLTIAQSRFHTLLSCSWPSTPFCTCRVFSKAMRYNTHRYLPGFPPVKSVTSLSLATTTLKAEKKSKGQKCQLSVKSQDLNDQEYQKHSKQF